LDTIIQQFSDEDQKNIFLSIEFQDKLIVTLERNYAQEFNESTTILYRFFELFKQYMERSMYLEQNSLSTVNHKIADVVNKWLRIKQG